MLVRKAEVSLPLLGPLQTIFLSNNLLPAHVGYSPSWMKTMSQTLTTSISVKVKCTESSNAASRRPSQCPQSKATAGTRPRGGFTVFQRGYQGEG